MRVAVIGAGPAGAWASNLLARSGHRITLFDSQAPWEKPCGGGITTKALAHPEIFSADLPQKQVEKITVFFGDRHSVTIPAERPLAIVSRLDLGRRLLEEAVRAGAEFIKDRVTRIEKKPGGWVVATREREVQVDFLVGADGATSTVRRSLGHPLAPGDLAVTLGYFIPGEAPPHMKIFFVSALQGYIWSFPRPGHISYGLITRNGPGWTVRAKTLLANFIMADLGPEAMTGAEPYSALVPCLRPRSWAGNTIEGERWALVGDAAGLTDPITGEGIHFAIQSAEALARTIDMPGRYSQTVWEEMGKELARASRMYRRFYTGKFMAGDFRKRAVQFSSRSRTLRGIIGAFIAGEQPYTTLKKKLFLSAPRVGWELIRNK
jgi:geranylgeranyl reductase family protein